MIGSAGGPRPLHMGVARGLREAGAGPGTPVPPEAATGSPRGCSGPRASRRAARCRGADLIHLTGGRIGVTEMDRAGTGRPGDGGPRRGGWDGLAERITAADTLRGTREAWPGLSLYERFEQVVTVILTGLIGLVIVAAVVNLSIRVVLLVVFGLLDPAEHGVFQAVFGMIFTVLIALEFNHSILGVLHRKESIIQVRTVVLIALLALVRKFIILDASKTEPLTIIGLAAAVLALGTVHWLVRDQDRRDGRAAAEDAATPET